jgi:F-type H+-transporting ATPase subunit delta
MSVASRIADRYAKSLFDLALERNAVEEVNNSMTLFLEVAKNDEFKAVLRSPIIAHDKKEKILRAVFGDKLDKISDAFIHLIADKGREAYLVDIAKSYRATYNKYMHISTVKVVTAADYSQAAIDQIIAKLKAAGQIEENTIVEVKVDPELVGGFVLRFDDKLYDASVAHQLDLLERRFSENVYMKQF